MTGLPVPASTWVLVGGIFIREDVQDRDAPRPVRHVCPTCSNEFLGVQGRRYCSPACRPSAAAWTPSEVRSSSKARYARLRRAGLCVACGQRPVDELVRCYICADRLAAGRIQ